MGEKSEYEIQIIFLTLVPCMLPIPLVLKFISGIIFTKFEFRTHTYRFLKYISFIDSLLLSILLFVPFVECHKVFPLRWLNENYYFSNYQLYIVLGLGNCLTTLSSTINLKASWNQFKFLQNFKITDRLFYLFLVFGFVFSIILNLPDVILHQITASTNSSVDETFSLKVSNIDYYLYYKITKIAF